MRNTAQYPITIDEMIDACKRQAQAIIDSYASAPENMPIGDITPMALQEAAKRLERIQFAVWDGKPNRKPKARKAKP